MKCMYTNYDEMDYDFFPCDIVKHLFSFNPHKDMIEQFSYYFQEITQHYPTNFFMLFYDEHVDFPTCDYLAFTDFLLNKESSFNIYDYSQLVYFEHNDPKHSFSTFHDFISHVKYQYHRCSDGLESTDATDYNNTFVLQTLFYKHYIPFELKDNKCISLIFGFHVPVRFHISQYNQTIHQQFVNECYDQVYEIIKKIKLKDKIITFDDLP